MNFSERTGITKPNTIIQINEIDDKLRNKLWNIIYIHVGMPLKDEYRDTTSLTRFYQFFINIWHDFLDKQIDEIPYSKYETMHEFKNHFFELEWYDIYNLIEFINKKPGPIDRFLFEKEVGEVLKNQLSGYRFIANQLVPITAEIELEEINESISKSDQFDLEGVKLHLESALSILSNKENPDYRNVIKESILAVESLCQILTKNPKAELGKALKLLNSKIEIHKALEEGFKKIYGYTSDADGIRHALLEKDNLDLEDAKYMLISCSSFINYLVVKGDKANLLK